MVGGRAATGRPALLGTLCALVTAAAYLPGSGRSLTYDSAESVGFFVLADSPVDALKGQRAFNNHPLFSFLENLIVHAAGHSDEWLLRLLPITCAAVAVGVVVWAVARWGGALPGLIAGLVIATNPMYVEQGRDVRGYSLMVLVAVVSTILHLDLVERESRTRRLAYVIVAVAGFVTHFAIAPVFLGHAVHVLRRRALDRAWLTTWIAAAALGLGFYAPMMDELLATGESRGRVFKPWFLPQLLRELLGHAWPAVAILGALVVHELYRSRRSTRVQSFVAVTVVVAVAAWLAAPENLAPRFFLWAVPAVAILAARGGTDRPRLLLAGTAVAVASSIASFAPSYTESVNRYPEVGQIIDRESSEGRAVCVTDLSVAPVLAYTSAFDAVTEPDQVAGCDVVAIVEPTLDEEYLPILQRRFPHRMVLEASDPAIIFSRRPIEPPGPVG